MKSIRLLAAAVAPLLLASCATVINNEAVPVLINSQPPGAATEIYKPDGTRIDRGVTPMTVDLRRDFGYFKRPCYRVVMEHPGYSRAEVTLQARPNWSWYVGGNALVGGVIGWLAVDPGTGAMWNFDPLNAVLMPSGPAPAPAPAPQPHPAQPPHTTVTHPLPPPVAHPAPTPPHVTPANPVPPAGPYPATAHVPAATNVHAARPHPPAMTNAPAPLTTAPTPPADSYAAPEHRPPGADAPPAP